MIFGWQSSRWIGDKHGALAPQNEERLKVSRPKKLISLTSLAPQL